MIRLFPSTLISSCRSLASGDSGMDRIACHYGRSTLSRHTHLYRDRTGRMQHWPNAPPVSVGEPRFLPPIETVAALDAVVHPFIHLPTS